MVHEREVLDRLQKKALNLPLVSTLHRTPGGDNSLKMISGPAVIFTAEMAGFSWQEFFNHNMAVLFPVAVGVIGLSIFTDWNTIRSRNWSANPITMATMVKLREQKIIKNPRIREWLQTPTAVTAVSNLFVYGISPQFSFPLLASIAAKDPSAYMSMIISGMLGATFFGVMNALELKYPNRISGRKN